ncbi:hypothetical protein IRZ71_17145 [Flavobacterium sp. ANB]|jgi:hypothetical protein|uniref:hypothetical protein n=1 Tax=unclassified Flavobacterium TaxID=196869 RepID=UPI0012B75540|nr:MULTISPECIES: hypothetical protein [unclassified Flavobacterium]MBF4518094.1 hypothetical protein [Flavobacterium sp. ANB]MTD71162.1 hypothetical protein [Flavobacterium sp. LC2016-13]
MKISKTMDKSKTKIYKSYDANILQALFIKYGLSKYYIRQSISGSVQGITPESIKKDYVTMEKASKDIIAILIQKTMGTENK